MLQNHESLFSLGLWNFQKPNFFHVSDPNSFADRGVTIAPPKSPKGWKYHSWAGSKAGIDFLLDPDPDTELPSDYGSRIRAGFITPLSQKQNQTAYFLPCGMIAAAGTTFPMGYFMTASACLPLCQRTSHGLFMTLPNRFRDLPPHLRDVELILALVCLRISCITKMLPNLF